MLGIGVYLGIVGTLTARMLARPSVILSLIFLLAAPLSVQAVDDLEEAMLALLVLGTPLLFCFNFLLEWGYRGHDVNGELVRLPLALAQFGG